MHSLRPLPSLRLWLQSTILLAVIAGYCLLFAIHSSFAQRERRLLHRQLVTALIASASLSDLIELSSLDRGLEVRQLAAGDATDPIESVDAKGEVWIESHTPFVVARSNSSLLFVRQNITALRVSERQVQMLLIAAAGFSVLLTAALLRLVLWRGLAIPLAAVQRELLILEPDSLGQRLLDPSLQPRELQPIAGAFNALQSRLAQAWQRERRFVDGVAHELRTPITVISSHAQRLQAESSQNSSAAVALIAAEAKRLGELISVMLDFARVDAGRLALVVDDLDPEAVLLESFERLQGLAPDRLQLAPSVEGDLPLIHADPARLHQCLAALVDNALRYSEGSVELGVSASSIGVTLHVRDQGPGIPVAERDQVLERFVRGSTASGTQGSGLGLAIVDDLMRAMQGQLVIAETPGGGADMQLRFRISDRPPAP